MVLCYLSPEVRKRRGGRPVALVKVSPRTLKAPPGCPDTTVSDSGEVSDAKDEDEIPAGAVHSGSYVCSCLIALLP